MLLKRSMIDTWPRFKRKDFCPDLKRPLREVSSSTYLPLIKNRRMPTRCRALPEDEAFKEWLRNAKTRVFDLEHAKRKLAELESIFEESINDPDATNSD
jgi:hypothetical protein